MIISSRRRTKMNKTDTNISRIIVYSGFVKLKRKDLEKLKAIGKKVTISMAGVLIFARNVTPELVLETVESIQVHGIIKASPKVKEILKCIK